MAALEEESLSNEAWEKNTNPVKQFKQSVFNPFWRNPNLHSKSTVIEHSIHAYYTLCGKDSDNIKSPFNLSPTWGLIFQHLKIQGDLHYTLAEFLKIVTFKKFIEDKTTHTRKPNLDRNYCELKEAIEKNKNINHIENHVGLLDFPYLVNILALLSIQASQRLHEIAEQKKEASKIHYQNTSPFLDFIYNIHRRSHGLSSGNTSNLHNYVCDTYRNLEIAFYVMARLWLEIIAFFITPLWDAIKLVIAPIILFITFPIWYPIARSLYKDQKPPVVEEKVDVLEAEPESQIFEEQSSPSM